MTAVTVPGLEGEVRIRRDDFGIPHVEAGSERDVWCGMGYAAAQDRLWQMEYDRRRAVGRWAEVVGQSGLAGDVLARRMRLRDAAERDIGAMSEATRAAFAAYSEGVNAFLRCGELPPEYALAGVEPEPWEPWQSVAAFKIRHVLMGVWQEKLARAVLLARTGPEAFARFEDRAPRNSVVTVPPGGRIRRLYEEAGREIEAARELGFLTEVEAGSNAWAVSGSRTTTGKPVLCNDSHRALDVPNVYWQVHVHCPQFNVIGATFPGLPGFPHFGHNGRVGWAITHVGADYQDLYVEHFKNGRYLTPQGWQPAERREETISVRNAQPVRIETWATGHGPVVHGDPGTGEALSLRYTAIDEPCRTFEALCPMLTAATVHDLLEAQWEWVDPVNNLVTADVEGNIAYLTRGKLPLRSSRAHEQFPAPGWTGEHEWVGFVPFEEMPRIVNPPQGFILTANQTVVDCDTPYIARMFSDPFRAERILELLTAKPVMDPAEVAAMQGDTVSIAARFWIELARTLPAGAGDTERARRLFATWDGNLAPDSAAALLYACFRRISARHLLEPVVGEAIWDWAVSGEMPSTEYIIKHTISHLLWEAVHEGNLETTKRLRAMMPLALDEAWEYAQRIAGSDSSLWRWSDHHRTAARHTLAPGFPNASWMDPLPVGVGGDGDCIQAAGYTFAESNEFPITLLSVYRQVLDFSDLAHGSWVVPGGASGTPGSPHFGDQLHLWQTHRRVPMRYRSDEITAATSEEIVLQAEG